MSVQTSNLFKKSPNKIGKKINDYGKDGYDSDDPTGKLLIKVKNLKLNFIGYYIGRELVEHKLLQRYKDIIIVDKDEPIIPTLNEIYENLHPQLATAWIGLTRSTIDDKIQNYKLWVDLNGIPIGKHRFQLRAIKIHESSIQFKLKILNEFETSSRSSSLWDDSTGSPFELKDMSSTYDNIREVTKFSAVLIMSIITIVGNIFWYCAEYSIKLTHELTKVIEVMTPIIFGILDFMSKCIGGFYWLIYMLWHGNSDKPLKFPSTLTNTRPLAIMPSPAMRTKYNPSPYTIEKHNRRVYTRNS